MDLNILTLDDFNFEDKTVILRPDINSPINHETGELADDNRIRSSLPTICELTEMGAKVVILAHQGDIEDYRNLIDLTPHAKHLTKLLNRPVVFIDDVCGPTAVEHIKTLKAGELLLLNNVRYLTEEVSTFVKFVNLTPEQLSKTRLVRNLAPLADIYVNDACAAAHRFTPSLVGFAEVLPAAGGRLFIDEYRSLFHVNENPSHPCVFVLGGSRIADAFSMMEHVLGVGKADLVLTSGITGEVMLLAKEYKLGAPTEQLINDKGLISYIERAKLILENFEDKVLHPIDLVVDDNGRRVLTLDDLPSDKLLVDIGEMTIQRYSQVIAEAKTIIFNGPVGVYEQPVSADGTKHILNAIANSMGYSVLGGGDSVAAASKFGVREQLSYVCTSGGAMVRFLSGQVLPVVEALKRAAVRIATVSD
jgi:phosphoglycerate kinase